MSRKSQAAMEFLMTYGWALIVVLVAIAALAFFGVLNPGQFLPERCSFSPGLTCTDFSLSTGYATIIVINGMGDDISDIELSLGDWSCGAAGGNSRMLNGKEIRFICPIDINSEDAPSEGSKMKKELIFSGKTRNGLKKVVTGEMIAVAEEDSLNDGLVFYMPFNEYEINISDYSINDNVGTAYGNANWTSKGAIGGAYSFDGVNGFINASDIDFTDKIGGSLWMNLNNRDQPGFAIFHGSLSPPITKDEFRILYRGINYFMFRVRMDNSSAQLAIDSQNDSNMAANTWYNIAWTYNGSYLRLFLNGVDVNSSTAITGNINDLNSQTVFGAWLEAGGVTKYTNGSIDEIRIYNRALSDREIKRLYELGEEVS